MFLRADFHTHAIGDGAYGPATPDLVAAHVEAALEAGLDCIGVTDHDDLRPGLLAVDYAANHDLPILVLAGMEITTDEGHLVALGLDEPLPRWRSMTETVERIRDQGAISILPHPFFPQLRARRDVDAMERYNSRYGDFDVTENGVAIIASSDAHSPDDLLSSPFHMLVEVDAPTLANVANAIHAHRLEIVRESDSKPPIE